MPYITEQRLPPVLSVEMEREKEVSEQLKQASDATARLHDELRQTANPEAQVLMQLDKVMEEFNDFKKRSTRLWEEEIKRRDSRFYI